jgi:hypothetical protein
MQQRAALRPSATAYFPISLSPPSPSTAPERRLLATAVPHRVDHGCRWRYVLSFRSCFQLFHSYTTYVAMAIRNVASICFKVLVVSDVCYTQFIRMFHVFHFDVAKGS